MGDKTSFLQFDFNSGSKKGPIFFSDPINLISSYHFEEVPECLEKIETALAEGKYVAGFFSYELSYLFYHQRELKPAKRCMPLLWFGVYNAPVTKIENHSSKPYELKNWKMEVTKEEYGANFQKILHQIETNQVDQINYTAPFQADFKGDAYSFYSRLKKSQSADFCAYLKLDQFTILSASPELFFHIDKNQIKLRPMKGTSPRGRNYTEDLALKKKLETSQKNRLENSMTSEVLLKELQPIAENLKIENPFQIEKYPTVYQMTSEIVGSLKRDLSLFDLLKHLFPATSIAGVPKQKAHQLIAQLEPKPREVYCGAIGYFTPDQEALFNVPIRTAWIDQSGKTIHYNAGGGITKNSVLEEEYQEVLTKTHVLTHQNVDFELLETMLIEKGSIFLLEKHLTRLAESADYFDIPVNIPELRKKLEAEAQKVPTGKWRLRLLVPQKGTAHISVKKLSDFDSNKVILANQPINRNDLFHYHKTTHRDCYQKHQRKNRDVLDVLLWNEAEELTEFTIGNLVVEIDGKLFTPPLSSGILAGTFREKLIEDEIIQEQLLKKSDLPKIDRMWLINSVRKWVEVELI